MVEDSKGLHSVIKNYIIGSNSLMKLLNYHIISYTVRALYGETPVGTAFRSGKKGLIDLLDEDHLLPRDDDPELDASIVEVRQSKTKLYRVSTVLLYDSQW